MRTPTAHAEELKVQLRLRAGAAGARRGDDPGAQRRRPPAASPGSAERWPRRCSRATRKSSRWCRPTCGAAGDEELVRAGIVLTGGAAQAWKVRCDLAEELFHMPVRVGTPQHVTGLADVVASPMHVDRRRPAALRQPPRRPAPGAGRRVGGGRSWNRVSSLGQGRVLDERFALPRGRANDGAKRLRRERSEAAETAADTGTPAGRRTERAGTVTDPGTITTVAAIHLRRMGKCSNS
jgi:hypothetical protein